MLGGEVAQLTEDVRAGARELEDMADRARALICFDALRSLVRAR